MSCPHVHRCTALFDFKVYLQFFLFFIFVLVCETTCKVMKSLRIVLIRINKLKGISVLLCTCLIFTQSIITIDLNSILKNQFNPYYFVMHNRTPSKPKTITS